MRGISKELYKARARVAKALAHEVRLEIVSILEEKGSRCVCELTEELGVSQPSVSKHLSILKGAGIVNSRKEGLNVLYFLSTPCVTSFFACIDKVLHRNIEIRKEVLNSKS